MVQRSSAYIIRACGLNRLFSTAIAVLCLALSLSSVAQDTFIEDTVNISAVTVTAKAAPRLAPFTVVKIDTELLSRYGSSDLASLLQSASNLFVRRNGNQGLASVSVRGMSGSHTMVTWNDLPLNAPGNGFSDFAIIPVMAFSAVRITSGGADLDDVSGYIGGKVELGSDPVFSTGREAMTSLGTGSYGEFFSSASFTLGSPEFYGKLSAWGEKGKNDFRFINENAPGGPSAERRTNASYSSGGLMSDIAFTKRLSQVSAHFWLNDADRKLPGPVTTVQQDFGERQTDRSYRGVMKYSYESQRFTAGIMAGGSHDVNRYYHMLPSNNGDNISSTMIARVRLGYRITGKTGLVINAGDSFDRVSSLSFDGEEQRNVFSVSVAAKSNPVPRLNLMLQVRQIGVTGIKVSPEYTAGASWMLTRNGEHLLKMSLSRNTKLPCLNDLFWMPGGNPDLVPETSSGGELSWSFAGVRQSGDRNTLDLTIHGSRVDGLIQWIPGQSGLWHAVNLRGVNVSGFEARAGSQRSIADWKLKGWLNYAFNRSVIAGSDIVNDRAVGKQLIYAPLHHANINITGNRSWLRTGISAAWESRRFTTADNSEWLPSAFMTDAFAGAAITAGPVHLQTEVKVSNLLGTPVESVRNYPLPLRTFKVKLTLTWSDKPKENVQDL